MALRPGRPAVPPDPQAPQVRSREAGGAASGIHQPGRFDILMAGKNPAGRIRGLQGFV
jgi:hypothetical protein